MPKLKKKSAQVPFFPSSTIMSHIFVMSHVKIDDFFSAFINIINLFGQNYADFWHQWFSYAYVEFQWPPISKENLNITIFICIFIDQNINKNFFKGNHKKKCRDSHWTSLKKFLFSFNEYLFQMMDNLKLQQKTKLFQKKIKKLC